MDPISALGVASGVVTFVDFTTRLISTSKLIYQSKDGTSIENLQLEEIYTKFRDFSANLGDPKVPESISDGKPQGSSFQSQPPEDARALRQLALSCKEDCDKILHVLQSLRVPNGRRRAIKSVKVALKTGLGKDKIATIETRLDRVQRLMSMHVGSIISYQMTQLSYMVESMSNNRQILGPQQSTLDSMCIDLAKLKLDSNFEAMENDASTTETRFSSEQLTKLTDLLSKLAWAEEYMQAKIVTSSLNYDSRPIRHHAIPEAHRETFQWAFNSTLSNWLSEGSGIFWVSGKAGSGKSTFIKFLADHRSTRELLKDWAHPRELVIASHYFWSAGTTMQNSYQGLLQSLLFDIFASYPACIPVVCPDRWAAAKRGDWITQQDNLINSTSQWTIKELSDTLRAVAASENIPLRFCFFIDGLDEYDNDQTELCAVLRAMSLSPSIKICLSSRPWVVFEDSFGASTAQKVYMQDLTESDIRKFAQDQLETHPRWKLESTELDKKTKTSLVEQVTRRAEGVFLWAFLVTRSLREGLSNDDTITDMQKRLDRLPVGLEQLFKHILDSVDIIYHPKMAGALEVAIHAFQPLPLDIYWHLEKNFEEHDYAILCPVDAVSNLETERRREQCRRRINARTKGLLETRYYHNRVEFLHRTVRDFLLTRDMSNYLASKLPANFNVFHSIAKALLAHLKTTSHYHAEIAAVFRRQIGENTGSFIDQLNDALIYAAEGLETSLDPESRGSVEQTLDEYERAVAELVESSQVKVMSIFREPCDGKVLFREQVVRHELAPYVRLKLQSSGEYFAGFEISPLYSAIAPLGGWWDRIPPSVEMLKLLLSRHDEELNYTPTCLSEKGFPGYSPWFYFTELYMYRSDPRKDNWSNFANVVQNRTFGVFLSHGADPDSMPSGRSMRVKTIFARFLEVWSQDRHQLYISGLEESYLTTLDAFLRARPCLASGITSTSPKIVEMGVNRSAILDVCHWLSARPETTPATRCRTLDLVSGILQRIIKHCMNLDDDGGFLDIIESAISDSDTIDYYQDQLLQLIRAGGRWNGGPRARKRRLSLPTKQTPANNSASARGPREGSKRQNRGSSSWH
ncbi:hypothetical protein B0H66DRAFT_549813 [Apodospora peruviana]|uniref:NACHT domain-containing protein n=1 Tax=Apodospora peruviana TaxID=516989 RepID=A0AAE0IJ69_9PEZI|nr:hypothetical protein B0H66DRAFT_549813 [Apodospora peruviana]